jgi:hypothetical protein
VFSLDRIFPLWIECVLYLTLRDLARDARDQLSLQHGGGCSVPPRND